MTTRPPTLWQTILSVLSAIFGVQKSSIAERDFTKGHPILFIICGILVVITLMLLIAFIVSNVI
jgi:hypothetical protein